MRYTLGRHRNRKHVLSGQRESDLPLLVVVEQGGAAANPLDVYPLLAAQFSELSADPQGR